MIRALERTLYAPVAAVRPYLLLKGTLLLLALDVWLTRASHGGRYGAGGFNVAHWPVLDHLQPEITPTLFGTVCVLTGFLSILIALASRAPRWLIVLTFLLHTWSWAMSMLDSYQHHYLLSMVLAALIFFPPLTAEEALCPPAKERAAPETTGKRSKKKKRKKRPKEDPPPPPPSPGAFLRAPLRYTSAWAYVALGPSIGIVYAYTGLSKTDPEWLSGAALRRVVRLPESGLPPAGALDPIGPFRAVMELVGLEGPALWAVLGHSVVLVQIVCAVGYALAPLRDVSQHWITRAFAAVAMLTALSFHLGAEYMSLQIGWFSWYMVGYALIFFLPASWLGAAARTFVPVSGRQSGPEVMALRITLGLVLVFLGLSAESWSEMTLFEVKLSGIFGENLNTPMVLLGGALLAIAPLRWLTRLGETDESDARGSRAQLVVGVGAISIGAAGYAVDLPGAATAGVAVALTLAAAVIVSLFEAVDARKLHAYGVGAAVGALALFASISMSEVRWDYYRNLGGDSRRRGEHMEAYRAYAKANRYAPEGQDRLERQREMERILRERGELPAGGEE